jgi:hypothetical protein
MVFLYMKKAASLTIREVRVRRRSDDLDSKARQGHPYARRDVRHMRMGLDREAENKESRLL